MQDHPLIPVNGYIHNARAMHHFLSPSPLSPVTVLAMAGVAAPPPTISEEANLNKLTVLKDVDVDGRAARISPIQWRVAIWR